MRKILLFILCSCVAVAAAAAGIDEAKRLYREGNYEAAIAQLKPLLKKSPRDGNTNYWYGASLAALGQFDEAEAPLRKALERSVPEAALALANIAADRYEPAEARQMLERYTELMHKAKRTLPDDMDERISRLVLMENMLSRVERVAVVDSMVVDADLFFTHYRLAPEAGRLVTGDMARIPDAEMAFIPQNNTQIIYSEPDSTDRFVLMYADILDDGTLDAPQPLPGDDLAGGGNAEYPFMLNDGLTLYFANDGEGSIGGYDIFMTRRGENGFLQPQNVGMPFNSPFDDYMMAIDETTGAGWWATDRNQIPGKVTIYIFIPSENRVNISEDDPNLAAYARLSDISLTTGGEAHSIILPGEESVTNSASFSDDVDDFGNSTVSFILPMGTPMVVYHRLSDFNSDAARASMSQAINVRAEISSINARLAKLREAYRKGDRSQNVNILNLEHQLDDARQRMRAFTNRAISQEME